MKVLALDTATKLVGWAVVTDPHTLVDYGLLDYRKSSSFGEMLRLFRNDLIKLIRRTKPEAVAIEGLHMTRNMDTVRKLSGVIAIVHMTVNELFNEEPIVKGPREVRKVLGTNGKRAEAKKKTRLAINRRFDLNLKDKDDNESDAIALAWVVANERMEA